MSSLFAVDGLGLPAKPSLEALLGGRGYFAFSAVFTTGYAWRTTRVSDKKRLHRPEELNERGSAVEVVK